MTDFAKLTFPGKLIEDTNPDSLADSITLTIGDIRESCVSMATSELIDGKEIATYMPKGSFPPEIIAPLHIPRPPRPTFFRLVARLP